jgi:6-pyruvoyltetrahydropterin/6-carboxytetrahydropterin synthase
MQITKTFHFYASHRNEELKDKCFSLHGHTYYVTCTFDVVRSKENVNITTLFSAFNEVEHVVKGVMDHASLFHVNDPLLGYILAYERDKGVEMKKYIMSRPTSVENLSFELFHMITLMGFVLDHVRIQETTTSIVVYNKADYESDSRQFLEEVKWCECVFEGKKNCMICGRSEWDYRIAKKRRIYEQSAKGTTVADGTVDT